jgi:hypothetical protein
MNIPTRKNPWGPLQLRRLPSGGRSRYWSPDRTGLSRTSVQFKFGPAQ